VDDANEPRSGLARGAGGDPHRQRIGRTRRAGAVLPAAPPGGSSPSPRARTPCRAPSTGLRPVGAPTTACAPPPTARGAGTTCRCRSACDRQLGIDRPDGRKDIEPVDPGQHRSSVSGA